MDTEGVDVRPLRQVTGIWEFNEVFLDQVFVPYDQVVANPGDGWRIAVTTLSNERLAMGSATFGHGSSTLVRRLLDSGDYAGSRDDTIRVLGRNTALELSVAALNLRNALTQLNGIADTDTVANSVRKVWHALAQREASRALTSVLGPRAALGHPEQPYTFDLLGLPAILFGAAPSRFSSISLPSACWDCSADGGSGNPLIYLAAGIAVSPAELPPTSRQQSDNTGVGNASMSGVCA